MKLLTQGIILLASVWLTIAYRCRGKWRNSDCLESWKCVRPMSEFECGSQCVVKGGIPGALICMSRNDTGWINTSGRYCVKDLKNGKFGFAKNLRKNIKDENDKKLKETFEEDEDEKLYGAEKTEL